MVQTTLLSVKKDLLLWRKSKVNSNTPFPEELLKKISKLLKIHKASIIQKELQLSGKKICELKNRHKITVKKEIAPKLIPLSNSIGNNFLNKETEIELTNSKGCKLKISNINSKLEDIVFLFLKGEE